MDWESVSDCLVLLPSEEGTAFLVSPEGYAFTCCHVIENKEINSEIDCIYQNEDTKARVIFKNEKLDFGIIKVLHNEILSTPFFHVDLGIEPITGTEDDIKIAGFTKVEQLRYIFRPTKLTHTKYQLKETSNLYLALKDKVIPGMSGGPVWHERSGTVIGIANAKIEHELLEDLKYGLAIPMSQIIDYISQSLDRSESIKKLGKELQMRLKPISIKGFIKHNIKIALNLKDVEPFRSFGPQLVDFEKGDWIYIPSIANNIFERIQKGKIVILGGKPATGKSVITRYLGYKSLSVKNNEVYYIDFLNLIDSDIINVLQNLDKFIAGNQFKNLKLSDKSPLFIFENIHDPRLHQFQTVERSFIPSLKVLEGKVKILITSRGDLTQFSWIDKENKINLDDESDLNEEITKGILAKYNRIRRASGLNEIIWRIKDKPENLWLLGWFLRVVYTTQMPDLELIDNQVITKEMKNEIEKYFKKNFPDFPTHQIITILLIISVISKYETPIEEDFIINNVISKFQGLDTNNTKQIIDILERKREISSKKIENLEDMSVVSFEYRIPHIKLAEILQDIYLNEYNKEKYDTILIDYIQKGKNTEILGHNLWIQEKFQLALKSFKLNKVEEDLIKIYLKYCKFKIKVLKGHVHDLDFYNSSLSDIFKYKSKIIQNKHVFLF